MNTRKKGMLRNWGHDETVEQDREKQRIEETKGREATVERNNNKNTKGLKFTKGYTSVLRSLLMNLYLIFALY